MHIYSYLRYLSIVFFAFITACSTMPTDSLRINTSHSAQGKNSRVRHIVLHYTVADTPKSLKILTEKNVSSHYLITDESPPTVYQLVDESERAWHAGVSQWFDHTDLNTSSIGIEIVNAGRQNDGRWDSFSQEQIEVLLLLLEDIIQRHPVAPANIVGHSDIAPQRKLDPGPKFPWKTLAEHGYGRWYDERLASAYTARFTQKELPSVASIQNWLQQAGYTVPQHGKLDDETKNVIAAFQMHYRPARYDGEIDAQTAGILKALISPKSSASVSP